MSKLENYELMIQNMVLASADRNLTSEALIESIRHLGPDRESFSFWMGSNKEHNVVVENQWLEWLKFTKEKDLVRLRHDLWYRNAGDWGHLFLLEEESQYGLHRGTIYRFQKDDRGYGRWERSEGYMGLQSMMVSERYEMPPINNFDDLAFCLPFVKNAGDIGDSFMGWRAHMSPLHTENLSDLDYKTTHGDWGVSVRHHGYCEYAAVMVYHHERHPEHEKMDALASAYAHVVRVNPEKRIEFTQRETVEEEIKALEELYVQLLDEKKAAEPKKPEPKATQQVPVCVALGLGALFF